MPLPPASTPNRPRQTTHLDNYNHSPPAPPSSSKKPLNGLFQDGQWLCNCQPRQPAACLQVVKDLPSRGQWFYKCRSRPQCDFFLWEYMAKLREGYNHFHHQQSDTTTTTPSKTPASTPSLTQMPLTSFGILRSSANSSGNTDTVVGAETAPRTTTTPTTQRKRQKDEEDDFGDLDSEEERQLATIVDESARKLAKKRTKTNQQQDSSNSNNALYTTPTTLRTVDITAGLPTPSVTRTLFAKSIDKRHKTVSLESCPSPSLSSSSTPPTITNSNTTTISSQTPTAISFTSPVKQTPTTTTSASKYLNNNNNNDDTASQILSLLRPHNLHPSVLKSVEALLDKAARRTRGIVLGRDSARAAAREKDLVIARLQERVAALENKDRMNRSQLMNMKAGIMRVYQDS